MHIRGSRRTSLARRLPILDWLPRYSRASLRGDLIAGVAVTALIVPKNLGYAGIAGVPLQNGLYAAAAGALIYALFCTSRQISTGPSSSLAAVAGGAVLVDRRRRARRRPQLVAAITLVTGALFLLMALLRLGWIARFLSKAVITGFLAGAAIDVVIGELPKLTGTSGDGDNAWQELGSWLGSLGDTHGTTLLVGLASLARDPRARASSRRRSRARSCWWSAACWPRRCFDLGAHGVALVGDVPSGLPSPDAPRRAHVFTDHAATIAIAAVALLLIGFSQTAGDARAFAARHRYRIDVNQESIAQGMANAGAGAVPGHAGLDEPVGELAQRVLRRPHAAGLARRPERWSCSRCWSWRRCSRTCRRPCSAALIIDAVVFGMIDVAELRRLHRVARVDFWIATAAIVGVLSAGVLAGVVIGVALSLAVAHLRRHARRAIPLLGARARHAGLPRRRTSIPTTRRSTGSSSCGWTSASPSRPPRRSRSGSRG